MNLKVKFISVIFVLIYTLSLYGQSPLYRFAVIGDYGKAGVNEYNVSVLVKSWNPSFIITTGDNNYELGEASTIDSNIGQYYHEFISPYYGGFGNGDTVNRFFPCLGNHDWYTAGAIPYLNYFTLPGNERYYTFTKPPVQFFAVDSDTNEPNGITAGSVQGLWVQSALVSSTSRFKIVYFHHPAYSSGMHGSTSALQWPFRTWGASIVLNGHDHDYERLNVNNFPYIVNGLGGKSIYTFGSPLPGSIIRYNGNYGAQLVSVYQDSVNFKFYSVTGTLIDSYTITYIPASITQISNQAREFYLYQNYPNPFNPSTIIKFDVPNISPPLREVPEEQGVSRVFVNLAICDILGREIFVPVNQSLSSGTYEVEWNASNYPAGVYLYRLQAGEFFQTRKLMIIK